MKGRIMSVYVQRTWPGIVPSQTAMVFLSSSSFARQVYGIDEEMVAEERIFIT